MADLNLPQFSNEYDGYKMRTMVDTLQNRFRNINSVFAFTNRAPYQIYANVTPVGNVGAGEDNLMSYTLGANALKKEGYNIKVEAWGTFATNANLKQLKMYFGSTLIYNSTLIALNGGSWKINSTITRVNATSEQSIVTIISDNSSLADASTFTNCSENLSTDILVKLTGTAISDNDIVQKGMLITIYPQEV